MTADGDLLDEMRFAYAVCNLHPASLVLVFSVTKEAASVIGVRQAGDLETGAYADFIALNSTSDPTTALCQSHRADLALVVRGGEPQIGDPDVMARFPQVKTVRARLDDREKSINVKLARQIARCTLKEPGLELLEDPSEPPLSRLWNGVLRP